MLKQSLINGRWPNTHQELLLDAALLPLDRALDAWNNWTRSVDIQSADTSSTRLLPFVFRRLNDFIVNNSLRATLKGIYRQSWYRNNLIIKDLGNIVSALESNGVHTLLLKGAALSSQYYTDSATRPMNDVDILIRQVDVNSAISILQKIGWDTEKHGKILPIDDLLLSSMHALPFHQKSRLFPCDLHWHVLARRYDENVDSIYWKSSKEFNLLAPDGSEIITRVLAPEDQLLHACIHGLDWEDSTPIRWILDASQILNKHKDQFDWLILLEHAVLARSTLRLGKALHYLQSRFKLPIPEQIIATLENKSVSVSEKIEYMLTGYPQEMLGAFQPFIRYYFGYFQSQRENSSFLSSIYSFPRFLKTFWELDSFWKVPFSGIRRILTRTWSMFRFYIRAFKRLAIKS